MHTYIQTGKQTDIQIYKQRQKVTDKEVDRQTYLHIDSQTKSNRHTDR